MLRESPGGLWLYYSITPVNSQWVLDPGGRTTFTFTSLPVLGQPVARLTPGAGVRSVCVDTHPASTQVTLNTLIHIWKKQQEQKWANINGHFYGIKKKNRSRKQRAFTLKSISRWFKSLPAVLASVRTWVVDADSRMAGITGSTLIHIWGE